MTYFLGLGFESSQNQIQATALSVQLALKHALTCLWTCGKDTKICKYLTFCSCRWQHFIIQPTISGIFSQNLARNCFKFMVQSLYSLKYLNEKYLSQLKSNGYFV